MTMSPKRRSPARRRTRVGVSLQLVAMLAAGVALVASPLRGRDAVRRRGSPGRHCPGVGLRAQLGAPVQRADLAPPAQLHRDLLRQDELPQRGRGLPRLLGHRLPRPAWDPIYAAGAGILHIGANERTCGTVLDASAGVWVWVDHGGGRVTKYTHLDSIVATEGQLVTPTDRHRPDGPLGRRRPVHDQLPALRGARARRQRPGSTRARCRPARSAGRYRCPARSTAPPRSTRCPSSPTRLPPSTSSCITDVWNQTPARPTLSAVASAVLGETHLERAAGRDDLGAGRHAAVEPELERAGTRDDLHAPSPVLRRARRWPASPTDARTACSSPTRTPPATAPGRRRSTVVPATVPSVPKAPRFLTSPTRDYVHYGWYKSTDNGAAVTRYTTQVRCYKLDHYLPWVTATDRRGDLLLQPPWAHRLRHVPGAGAGRERHGCQRLVDGEHDQEGAVVRPRQGSG